MDTAFLVCGRLVYVTNDFKTFASQAGIDSEDKPGLYEVTHLTSDNIIPYYAENSYVTRKHGAVVYFADEYIVKERIEDNFRLITEVAVEVLSILYRQIGVKDQCDIRLTAASIANIAEEIKRKVGDYIANEKKGGKK